MNIYIKTMTEDDDKEVVAQACMSIADIVKDCGFAAVELCKLQFLTVKCLEILGYAAKLFLMSLFQICHGLQRQHLLCYVKNHAVSKLSQTVKRMLTLITMKSSWTQFQIFCLLLRE